MKRVIAFIILASTLIISCACQPTPTTPPVVSKNDGTLEKEIYEGAPAGWELDLPESFSYEKGLYLGHVTVKAEEAEIDCARTAEFPVYEGTFHAFTADDIQKYIDLCFDGGEIFYHNTVLSKDEITRLYLIPAKEDLWKMENGEYELFDKPLISDEDGSFIDMERYKEQLIEAQKHSISVYEEMVENAPANVVRKKVDFTEYDPYYGIDLDVIREGGNVGRVRVTHLGRLLQISLGAYMLEKSTDPMNNYTKIELYNTLSLENSDDPDYADRDMDAALMALKLSREETVEQAAEYVEKLGLSDVYKWAYTGYAMCASNYSAVFKPSVTEYDSADYGMQYYYSVTFTRDVDGIMVAERNGAADVEGEEWNPLDNFANYSMGFKLEAVNVYVNDSGVCGFTFKAPLEVEKVQNSVKLLDFDEAMERAAQQTVYHAMSKTGIKADMEPEEIQKKGYFDTEITRVNLRYIECAVKDDASVIRLIPAWLCYADAYKTNSKRKRTEKWSHDDTFYPYVVIYAIDGSTYNLGLGY